MVEERPRTWTEDSHLGRLWCHITACAMPGCGALSPPACALHGDIETWHVARPSIPVQKMWPEMLPEHRDILRSAFMIMPCWFCERHDA